MQGYIKLNRDIIGHPVAHKDPEHLAVWIYFLTHATYKKITVTFAGQKIELQPGQLIATTAEIARESKVSEQKTRRIIENFIFDKQIDKQKSNRNSLFTVLNWSAYQISDKQNDTPLTNHRQTDSRGEMYINNKYNNKKSKNVRNNSAGARNKFHNFSQRNYSKKDFDELEKIIARRD